VWCADPGPGPCWGTNPGVRDSDSDSGELRAITALIVFMSVCMQCIRYVCMNVCVYLYMCVYVYAVH
jgi:hypothetical protein